MGFKLVFKFVQQNDWTWIWNIIHNQQISQTFIFLQILRPNQFFSLLRLPKNWKVAKRLIAHHAALLLRTVKFKQAVTALKTIHYRHIDIQYYHIEVVVVIAVHDLQRLKTILCCFYIESSWKLLSIALQNKVLIVYQQHFWLFGLRHNQGLKISASLRQWVYLWTPINKLRYTFVFLVRIILVFLLDFTLEFYFAHGFEIYAKRRSLIYFTLNFNRTPHLFHYHFANWQTESSTLCVLLPMFLQIIKVYK